MYVLRTGRPSRCGVALTLGPGKTGLLGPNGAGKSTLMDPGDGHETNVGSGSLERHSGAGLETSVGALSGRIRTRGAPIFAPASHSGAAGIAIVAIAGAACALAIAFGAIVRSSLLFECLAILAWYLGPVDRAPGVDPAQSIRAPLAITSIALAFAFIALGAAALRAGSRS